MGRRKQGVKMDSQKNKYSGFWENRKLWPGKRTKETCFGSRVVLSKQRDRIISEEGVWVQREKRFRQEL